jgi:hypothetical protein
VAAEGNSFEHSLLKDYGDCLCHYHGKGVITLEDGKKFDCLFEAGQLTSGQVLLLCDFLPPLPTYLSISATKFEGTTSDGFRIWATEAFSETSYLPDIPLDRSSGVWAAFHIHKMIVQIAEDGRSQSLHFGITNLEFIGTQPTRGPDNSFYLILSLDLQTDSRSTRLLIKPLDLNAKILKRIRTLKGIDVSCEIIAEIPVDAGVAMVTEVVDDLCYILSVARGTKIQWVYCDSYDGSGKLLSRNLCSRITKPYCPLEIIHPLAGGGKETKIFVEQAYPAYVNKRERYKLHKGTIDAYLDAKAEADYLEIRGVKFAVSMEILKKVFCESMNIKGGSFKSLIENLCSSISLNVSKGEIDLFVKSRNSLIHEGEFYCITVTKGEKKKCKPLSTKTEEYLFLVNFLDKVFLKLLGYNGPYIDWSVPDKPAHREHVQV